MPYDLTEPLVIGITGDIPGRGPAKIPKINIIIHRNS